MTYWTNICHSIQYAFIIYIIELVIISLSEKDLRQLCSNINNIDYLDSWFRQSCVKESIALYKSFQYRYKEHEETRE